MEHPYEVAAREMQEAANVGDLEAGQAHLEEIERRLVRDVELVLDSHPDPYPFTLMLASAVLYAGMASSGLGEAAILRDMHYAASAALDRSDPASHMLWNPGDEQ